VDPSLSRIEGEHEFLSEYLYDRFLTVDAFDGDSLFLYGSFKLPLFELLRQGKTAAVRAKECEMCDPENGEFRGAVQLIMSNSGRVPNVYEERHEPSPEAKRLQPSQSQHKHKKLVRSKPMDLTKHQHETQSATTIRGMTGSFNFKDSLLNQITPQEAEAVS